MVATLLRSESGGVSLSQPNALRDVLLVGAPIAVFGALGNMLGLETLAGGAMVNFGYLLAIVLGAYVLGRQNSSWWDLGLGRPSSLPRTLLLGIMAAVGAILVAVAAQLVVPAVLVELGTSRAPGVDQSRFNPIAGNLPLFVLMVVLAWTTIAFGEELFYRAFLLSRLVDHAGIGRWVAVLVAGAVFGAVHFAEGPLGLVSNGALGVLFGWIYLRSGRNLWITVIGHGLINTLRFGLLYAGVV